MISRDDVLHLAALSRLELTEDEVDRFTHQLHDILIFARQIESVPVTPVADADSAPDGGIASPLREDAAGASLDRAEALSAAAEADGSRGVFTVPRVLQE